MQSTIPQPVFLNLEYLFLKIGSWFVHIGSSIFTLHAFYVIKFCTGILVVLLITSILYSLVRLYEMDQAKKQHVPKVSSLTPSAVPVSLPTNGKTVVTAEGLKNPTWENIRAKLLSENQSEWRIGIIEADIYLDKLLDDRGYHGDTVSDKLKQVVSGDLASIQIAWEAHKVRNRIAHEGETYTLTMPEARRVLSYFEIVFRDLGVIE